MSDSLARVSFFTVQRINPRVFLSATGQYFRHSPVLLCHRVFVALMLACFWLGWSFANLGPLLLGVSIIFFWRPILLFSFRTLLVSRDSVYKQRFPKRCTQRCSSLYTPKAKPKLLPLLLPLTPRRRRCTLTGVLLPRLLEIRQ